MGSKPARRVFTRDALAPGLVRVCGFGMAADYVRFIDPAGQKTTKSQVVGRKSSTLRYI